MPTTSTLNVQGRDRAGKGAARATRRSGLVPGVIYGGNQDTTLIALDPRVLKTLMYTPGFRRNVFEIELNGKTQRTMAMDVQTDPVSAQTKYFLPAILTVARDGAARDTTLGRAADLLVRLTWR